MVWLEMFVGGAEGDNLLVRGLQAGLILSCKSIPIQQLLPPTHMGEPN